MFYLVIKNNGKTAAERVGFKFDRSIENMWKKKIEELPLFKEGITFFPPGKEFVVTLGPTYLFLSNKKEEIKYPSNFTIIVKYSYFDKIKKTESTTINLEEYMDTRSYPNEIIKSLETLDGTLRKGLESIAKSAEKLSKIELPSWMSVDSIKKTGKILGLPKTEDFERNFDVKLIIEYYSTR